MATENIQVLKLPCEGLPLTVRLLYRWFKHAGKGSLHFTVNNRTYLHEGTAPGYEADITFHQPLKTFQRIALSGDIGFAESYLDGEWTTDNLTALLCWGAQNIDDLSGLSSGSLLLRGMQRLKHLLRHNSKKGSRKNIAAHYDLGNDFYALWLDNSMTYSSAINLPLNNNEIYPAERLQTLYQAQQQKYARLLQQLDAKPGQHILEIGCGWGGFAEYAASQGYKVTGVTLSKEQLNYAKERIDKAGLSERVSLKLCDYRDINDKFDHIVSIEMFEAVGEAYWPSYFSTLKRCLKPGGHISLQLITISNEQFENYRKGADFIQLYIFPGGMLPSVEVFNNHCEQVKLRPIDTQFFAHDYAQTLAYWHQRFNEVVNQVQSQGFDRRFINMWRYYLSYCEAGFLQERINLMQVTLKATSD